MLPPRVPLPLGNVIGAGRIGEPLLVEGDFGFRRPVDPTHRHFAADLGGGAVLDLGIYPLQLCTLVLGPVERVVADGSSGRPASTRSSPPLRIIRRAGWAWSRRPSV